MVGNVHRNPFASKHAVYYNEMKVDKHFEKGTEEVVSRTSSWYVDV